MNKKQMLFVVMLILGSLYIGTQYVKIASGRSDFDSSKSATAASGLPPNGLLPNDEPEPLSPIVPIEPLGSVLGSATTWMKTKIPYFFQRQTQWCWATSLVMLHQWWSPTGASLGGAYSQQSEIVRYIKGSEVNQGASADEVLRVLKEWGNINSQYENFQFTWKGQGRLLSAGDPTGYADDPKTWLAYVQAPVIACVDTDGDGSANHAVLIVGYDDSLNGGTVFIHDPWTSNWWPGHSSDPCYELSLTYTEFNQRWNSWFEGPLWAKEYRGLIAGIPGDNQYCVASTDISNFPSSIQDSSVPNVQFSLSCWGGDKGSTRFSYAQGIQVRVSGGEIASASAGGFISYQCYDENANPVPTVGARIIEFYSSFALPPSNTIYAFVSIKPTALGTMYVYYRGWITDEDDRTHCAVHTYSIDEDRPGTLTTQSAELIIARDPSDSYNDRQGFLTYPTKTASTSVVDDDTSGPVYSNIQSIPSSPIQDNYLGSIRIQADVTDTSGVYSVAFGYGYHGVIDYWVSASGNSGSTYWYDIPRSEWIQHVGDTISWRIHAYDNDNDRPNDRADSYSDWRNVQLVDDDVSGPSYSGPSTSPSGTVYDTYSGSIRLQVSWSDSRGIYDVGFRYKYGSGSWTSWFSPSGSSGGTYWYDIPRSEWISQVGQTIYWESYATDNDNDGWSGDKLTSNMPTQTGPAIVSTTFNVHLDSQQNNSATVSYGKIVLDGSQYGLPTDVPKPTGSYSVYYLSSSGYVFDHWVTTGSVSVPNVSVNQTTLTVNGAGTLTAIYKAVVVTYAVHLDSQQNNSATVSYGKTVLDGSQYGLPTDVPKPTGSYSVYYLSSSGYVFDHWVTTGSVSVLSTSVNQTTATVSGAGTLTAIYKAVAVTYNVHLESRQNNSATSNLGSITFDSVPNTLPKDISKAAGGYPASYGPGVGYVFDSWETTGGISVSPNSQTTTVTVSGDGTLRAIYKVASSFGFEDGFESGNFSAWSGIGSSSGETSAVVNALAHHGVYSAKFTSDGSSTYEYTYCYRAISASSELYARGYFYVSQSGIVDSGDRFYFIQFRTGTGYVAWAGWRRTSSGVKWELMIRHGTGYVSAFSASIPSLSQWYSVELHWKKDATNGMAELWINGTLACSMIGKDTTAYGDATTVRFGLPEIQQCSPTTLYCDCCKIATTYIVPEPANIFEDGFESGNFSAWSGIGSSSGETSAVVNALAHHGVYSAKFTSDGSSTYEYTYCYRAISASSELYARGYFYVSQSGIVDSGDRFYFIQFRTGTGYVAWAGWRRTSSGVKWELMIRHGTGYVSAFSASIPSLSQWYSVELHWKKDATNGMAELWINGTLACSMIGKDTTAYGDATTVRFGLPEIQQCSPTTLYCDCCIISYASIGPASLGLTTQVSDFLFTADRKDTV
jgi:hypothetical protein